jgi:hypothetical protein
MQKVLLAVLAMLFLPLLRQDALGQNTPKAELGAQFSVLRLRDLGVTEAGFGGRFTINASSTFAIEAEVNFFPKDRDRPFESGRKTQGLFGVKYGLRSDQAGIYGKARVGFIHFTRNFDTSKVGKTDPAFDLGGVFELYPSGHSVVRFDLGDTIIRFGERTLQGGLRTSSFTSHNLQFNVGVGIRF